MSDEKKPVEVPPKRVLRTEKWVREVWPKTWKTPPDNLVRAVALMIIQREEELAFAVPAIFRKILEPEP